MEYDHKPRREEPWKRKQQCRNSEILFHKGAARINEEKRSAEVVYETKEETGRMSCMNWCLTESGKWEVRRISDSKFSTQHFDSGNEVPVTVRSY